MDWTDDAGKLQCSLFPLPSPSSLLHSAPVYGPVLRKCLHSVISRYPFSLPFRHQIPACAPPSRPHQGSDLLACTSRTTSQIFTRSRTTSPSAPNPTNTVKAIRSTVMCTVGHVLRHFCLPLGLLFELQPSRLKRAKPSLPFMSMTY